MSGSLQGKVAWITGGASGIGLGTGQVLSEAGATVILSGRTPERLQEAADSITSAGGRCHAIPLDVSDANAVAEAVRQIEESIGQIDVLVNNAGSNIPRRYLNEVSMADWAKMIEINLNGTLYCAHAVLPSMRKRRNGLIVNIASWGGKNVVRAAGSAYTAAKHAVVALTESINIEECVNNVRACALCPAEVSTPFLDQRPVPPTEEERQRFLQPRDIGRLILMLSELPSGTCVNELVVSPTLNPLYLAQHRTPVLS